MKTLARYQSAAAVCLLLVGAASAADEFAQARNRMVDEEIVAAGIKDPRVIESMRDTPRHEFMPVGKRDHAYFDQAVAIGEKQTISPPYVVAYMTEQLLPRPDDKVLEIGTGSGYQAAVLSPLVKDVYTIEIVKQLGERAARTLKRLKYTNVHPKIGDGYQGWPEHAPFDKIIVTCSPEDVPPKLVEQLREGGRMIVPVGERYQQMLYLFEKKDGKLNKLALLPTLFVPMTGQAEDGREVQPDPARPEIHNGGFEQVAQVADSAASDAASATTKSSPIGWHYQRQLRVTEAADAPEGKRYVTFSNQQAGRGSQALQGLAVDGRKVSALDISLWVTGRGLRDGSEPYQKAALGIAFYDDNRAEIGYRLVGPWRDTFDWRHVQETIRVPVRAREAVIRIGLGGATGELSLDAVRITPSK